MNKKLEIYSRALDAISIRMSALNEFYAKDYGRLKSDEVSWAKVKGALRVLSLLDDALVISGLKKEE